MSNSLFQKAVKQKAKLRLAIDGPPGSGKTWSALAIASGLGKKIAVIDTEGGSSSLYSDKFDFDIVILKDSYAVSEYTACIEEASAAGYDVLIIDSLSHAWEGKGGALESVEANKTRGNSFNAWKDVTPAHNKMVNAILSADLHVICTLRTKVEYVQEVNAAGKTVPHKIGTKPIQRDGMEYEFTLYGSINQEHQLVVTKSRFSDFADAIVDRPGKEMGAKLLKWLNAGASTSLPTKAVESPVLEQAAAVEAPAATPDELSATYQELAMRIDVVETEAELDALKPLVAEHKSVNPVEYKDLLGRFKAQKATLKTSAAGN